MAQRSLIQSFCPDCGSPLKLQADKRRVNCSKCRYSRNLGQPYSVQVVKKGLIDNLNLRKLERGFGAELNEYQCGTCKSNLGVDRNQSLEQCPFCHSEDLIQGKRQKDVLPVYEVIPFSVPKKMARFKLKRLLFPSIIHFLPKGLSKSIELEAIQGVYVPGFAYDVFTRNSWKGEAGFEFKDRGGSGGGGSGGQSKSGGGQNRSGGGPSKGGGSQNKSGGGPPKSGGEQNRGSGQNKGGQSKSGGGQSKGGGGQSRGGGGQSKGGGGQNKGGQNRSGGGQKKGGGGSQSKGGSGQSRGGGGQSKGGGGQNRSGGGGNRGGQNRGGGRSSGGGGSRGRGGSRGSRGGGRRGGGDDNVKWDPKSGYFEHMYGDQLVVATSGSNARDLQKIPYNLKDTVYFDPRYIGNWTVEMYQMPENKGFEAAEKMIDQDIKEKAGERLQGDKQQKLEVVSEKSLYGYRHVLLPLWVATFSYKGRRFQFLVNGQTGKAIGTPPLSNRKMLITLLSGIAVLLLLLLLLA